MLVTPRALSPRPPVWASFIARGVRVAAERGLRGLGGRPRGEGVVAAADGGEARAEVVVVAELLHHDRLVVASTSVELVLGVDLDPGDGERAGHRVAAGLDPQADSRTW